MGSIMVMGSIRMKKINKGYPGVVRYSILIANFGKAHEIPPTLHY